MKEGGRRRGKVKEGGGERMWKKEEVSEWDGRRRRENVKEGGGERM